MANQTNPKPAQATSEVGQSGTYFFKGYITAEEYSIDLQGKYGLQVYDVMRKSDPVIHAVLKICKDPILGSDWTIEPATSDAADLEIADRANYEFFQRDSEFDFFDVTREGLSFLDMGFYVGEKVFEPATYKGKSYIGLKKIGFRKQRSILKWEMDDSQPGVTQIIPAGGMAQIPRNKLLVCVNDREGQNYFGVSLLRYAYKPWKIKDGLEIMNAVALEKSAMGIPYIKKGIDGQVTDEGELQKARDILRQQRANEEASLEFPASIEIGWMDMKGNTTKDVIPTIKYQDQSILLSVLGQFLLLGQQDSGGSRAVSADHSRMFVKSLESIAKLWQQAFQRDVINQWAAMNYANLPNGAPRLVYSTISDEDVVEMASAVSSLMSAGALSGDPDSENRIRKSLNLPPLSDEAYKNYQPPEKSASKGPVDPPEIPGTQPKPPTGEPPKSEALTNARAAQKQLLQAIIDEE